MRVGPLNRPRQRAHRSHALAREVVALALAGLLLLRGLEASETYDSLPAASPRAGTAKHEAHTRATRKAAEKRLNHPPFPCPPDQCLSVSVVMSFSLSSHIYVFTAAGSRHTSSLRQLGEMPSLAGPKSRAQLASFTRLDDGAFCRVISASLWAPHDASCTTCLGAAGASAASYGQLAPVLPLAARVSFFWPHHHTEHLFLPLSWTGTYTWPGAICLAGRSPREISFNCRSGGPPWSVDCR
jgi:hypothetical protein